MLPDIAHTGAGPLQRSTMTLEGPAYSPRPRELPEPGVGLLYSVPATRQGAPSWKNVATNSLSRRTTRRKGGAGPPGDVTGFIPPMIAGGLPVGGVPYTDASAFAIKVTNDRWDARAVLTRLFEPEPVTDCIRRYEWERPVRGSQGDQLGARLR